MAKWGPMSEGFAQKGDSNSIFDIRHHGDEVIVTSDKDGKIKIAIKIQTGINEHRSILMTFDSQTQMERLLPSILKGLKP